MSHLRKWSRPQQEGPGSNTGRPRAAPECSRGTQTARELPASPTPCVQLHACLADLVVQVRVAVPSGLEGHQRLDGGGARRVQQRRPPAKQLRQYLRLRQAQPCQQGKGAWCTQTQMSTGWSTGHPTQRLQQGPELGWTRPGIYAGQKRQTTPCNPPSHPPTQHGARLLGCRILLLLLARLLGAAGGAAHLQGGWNAQR